MSKLTEIKTAGLEKLQRLKVMKDAGMEKLRQSHYERFVIVMAIFFLSIPSISPAHIFSTLLTQEYFQDLSMDELVPLAIGLIGAAHALSISLESRVLDKKNFSASPVASGMKALNKTSEASSSWSHAFNFVQLNSVSPLLFYTAVAGAVAGKGFDIKGLIPDFRFFVENAMGATLVLTVWKVFFNTLILYVDETVLRKPAEKIYERFKKKEAPAVAEVDSSS